MTVYVEEEITTRERKIDSIMEAPAIWLRELFCCENSQKNNGKPNSSFELFNLMILDKERRQEK